MTSGICRSATVVAAAAVVTAGLGVTTTPAVANPSARVVTRTDVNGDGVRDAVRVTKVRKGVTRVTVRTSHGKVRHKRLRTRWLSRAEWHGAARIDGRPGKELVLLTDAGAHSLVYTVLTWRHGRLVVERQPRGDRQWYTDGAVWISVGWKRSVRHGKVRMIHRSVTRELPHGKWHGKAITYRWKHGNWHKLHARRLHPSTRVAYKIGGWHVKGLRTWPK